MYKCKSIGCPQSFNHTMQLKRHRENVQNHNQVQVTLKLKMVSSAVDVVKYFFISLMRVDMQKKVLISKDEIHQQVWYILKNT